jgi:hypothetical protein
MLFVGRDHLTRGSTSTVGWPDATLVVWSVPLLLRPDDRTVPLRPLLVLPGWLSGAYTGNCATTSALRFGRPSLRLPPATRVGSGRLSIVCLIAGDVRVTPSAPTLF